MNDDLPNFLVVGAAKSGTTSLYHYLNQHPDIFIPARKEGRFFSQMPGDFQGPGAHYQNDVIRNIDEYKRFYQGHEDIVAKGDISNDYLVYHENSIANIKKYLGENVNIVILLRNPIDRAYSNYTQHVREGWEAASFETAIELEEDRKRQNWAWPFWYKEVGLYYNQVKAYMSNFRNVRVFLFEELFQSDKLFEELFIFLNVKPDFKINRSVRYNVSGIPANKLSCVLSRYTYRMRPLAMPLLDLFFSQECLQNVKNKIKKLYLKKQPMKSGTRRDLECYFNEDVSLLSDLIHKNLSVCWGFRKGISSE